MPRDTSATPHINCVPVRGGKVAAICEFCGARSRPCVPDKDGEPSMFDIGRGWTEAPYPHDFKHPDGSVGSLFACPKCEKRLRAGETLRSRGHIIREVR